MRRFVSGFGFGFGFRCEFQSGCGCELERRFEVAGLTRTPNANQNPNREQNAAPLNPRTQNHSAHFSNTLVPRIFCALSVLRKLGMI